MVSLLKKSLSTSKVDGHTDRVFAIANHPSNAHEFVSSGWDNTLQVNNHIYNFINLKYDVKSYSEMKNEIIQNYSNSSFGTFVVQTQSVPYMVYLFAVRGCLLIEEVRN